MRKAFSDTLFRCARENPRIIFLTADLGFQVFDAFREQFPGRYINVGVAEAQLVNAAVGLALEGWRPIIYSIAPFMVCRPFEQIKIGISYHALPVLIVGAGGGFTYSRAGVTHQAPDDLALISILPNIRIYAPGGPDELRELMPQILKLDGPSYMRVGKFGEPDVGHDSPVVPGKARKLCEGERVAVLSVGEIVAEVLPAVSQAHMEGTGPSHYHFHSVKPLDIETMEEIDARFNTMLVVEESIPQGGLYSEICRWKAEINSNLKICRRGASDSFVLGSPDREELRKILGIDRESVKTCIKELYKKEL
ncbi:MAG: transketolase family protein [Vulcanimicrobiota bacterium]